ncbi:MAG: zinc-binding alcohol dehydrogenase [Actinobacteria bacterium]|nr:MAG: zinc-binding alcohol dehydrogenase [Actinomycetota bacterium]
MKGRVLRFVAPRRVASSVVDVGPPGDGELLVRTHWSGISGGTELLAYRGELDAASARDETIASLSGRFEYPFAFGYSCVGEVLTSYVDDVPEGATVFAFHPHQDLFTVPGSDAIIIDKIEGRLATLFPLVETALQVALDAGPRLEELVVVMGLGPVGILTAALLDRAGAEVVGVDPRSDRRETAVLFGVPAVDVSEIGAVVEEVTGGAGVPLVVDAAGYPPALAHALELLCHEGEVLVCSWYGTKDVSLPLGREFHRRRLQIRSTQVSTVPAHLAERWDVRRRRRVATTLLGELPLKLLATHEVAFDQAAEAYEALDREDAGLMHVELRY